MLYHVGLLVGKQIMPSPYIFGGRYENMYILYTCENVDNYRWLMNVFKICLMILHSHTFNMLELYKYPCFRTMLYWRKTRVEITCKTGICSPNFCTIGKIWLFLLNLCVQRSKLQVYNISLWSFLSNIAIFDNLVSVITELSINMGN